MCKQCNKLYTIQNSHYIRNIQRYNVPL